MIGIALALVLLSFAGFFIVILGLINPKWVGRSERKDVLKYYFSATVLALVISIILSSFSDADDQNDLDIALSTGLHETLSAIDTPTPIIIKETVEVTVVVTNEVAVTLTHTPNPTNTQTPVVALLDYSIYKDNSTSDYGSFKVMWDIIINSEEITKPLLENLMNNLFEEAYQLLPGKNDDRTQLIFIYLYASKEHAMSGMGQWIGMVSKYADSSKPSLMFDELQLNALLETPEVSLGLSELERKQIWNEIIHAEDRAYAEAERIYPDLDDPFFDYLDELTLKYMTELSIETGLTLEQLEDIGYEGMLKNWPFPTQKNW